MNKKLMHSAIAGVVALGFGLVANMAQAQAKAETGTCKQTNDCKGKGGCASLDGKHGCAGKNDCGGHQFKGTKEQCEKHKGTVTPDAPAKK